MSGIRIRLDLSDFVHRVESKRMMFLDTLMVRTISDLQDKVREEHCECDDHDLLMFLEDGFLLPGWEPIQILQTGDLVKVFLKQSLKAEKKKKRKRGLDESIELSSKKAKILPRVFSSKTKFAVTSKVSSASNANKVMSKKPKESDSNDSSDSESDNEENNTAKEKPVTAKESVPKDKPEDDSSDSSEDSDDEKECAAVQKTAKKTVTEENSSSSSSDSESDSKVTTKPKQPVKKKPVAESSSSSEEDDSESEEGTKQVSKVPNKPMLTNDKNKAGDWSDDSSSSSDEEEVITKTKVVTSNHKLSVEKAKESSSHDSSASDSDTNTKSKEVSANKVNANQESANKKKRKRKRKNKNKNKLPPGEMMTFEEPVIVGKFNTPRNNEKKENSRIVFHDKTEVTTDNQKDDDQTNDMEFTAEDIQKLYAMSKPATPIAKSTTPCSASSILALSKANSASSTPSIKANYNVSKPNTPVEKSANKYSSLSECEQSILSSNNQEQVTPSYAKNKGQVVIKKNPFSFQPRVLTMNELKNGVSKKTIDKSLVTANGDNIYKDSPKTNGHNKSANKGYKPIDTSRDVYTNKSMIIRNPRKDNEDSNFAEDDNYESTDDTPTPTSNTKDYEVLEVALIDSIKVNDCVAFKMIEMSDSYTPELSGWKEGKVIARDGSVITFQVLSPVTKKKVGRFELNQEEDIEQDPIIQLDTRDIIDPRSVPK